MNLAVTSFGCAHPPAHVDLVVTLPGGAQLRAVDLLNTADPLQVVSSFFAAVNAGLAPLTPLFNLVDVVEALTDCVSAVPKCLLPPSPEPLLKVLPKLEKALAKVVAMLPPLSVPVLALQMVKALIVAVEALLGRLAAVVERSARIAAAQVKAAKPGNGALKVIVACAAENAAVDLANLSASLGPINQLVGLVNAFASQVPGLPQSLIPDVASLGPDAAATVQPLKDLIAVLGQVADLIPV